MYYDNNKERRMRDEAIGANLCVECVDGEERFGVVFKFPPEINYVDVRVTIKSFSKGEEFSFWADQYSNRNEYHENYHVTKCLTKSRWKATQLLNRVRVMLDYSCDWEDTPLKVNQIRHNKTIRI